MKYIQFFHELGKKDIQMVGGKGASLGELTQAGFPVPQGFIITTAAFKAFHKNRLPTAYIKELLDAFDKLKTPRVAVRSSAIAEDSSSASWAGLLESYLNITKDELVNAIEKCFESIDAKRAKTYAKQQEIPASKLLVAVIIQQMVNSEISGVMFTGNPVTNNLGELMIEAGYGLGELLVQGEITPDNYVVDKKTLRIKDKTLGSQKKMLIYQNNKNRKVSVPSRLQNKQILNKTQMEELAKLGKQIEKHYSLPQDIEWAIENGNIYIVQSRPITTLAINDDKKVPLLTTLPLQPKGVKYALTVPQSVLFADLSLQGNKREFFKQAMGINYEPQYVVIDAGGAMSWNYDNDKQFTKALIKQGSITNAVVKFIMTMEKTSKHLDKLSLSLSNSFDRTQTTEKLIQNLTNYWEAYKLHNTSLFTFWNVEYFLSQELVRLLKQADREDEVKNGLTRFFKPYKQNYFVIERLQLEKIQQRFSKSHTEKTLTLSTISPPFKNALEEHRKTFGFLLAPFNLGKPPSFGSLIKRLNEMTKMPKGDTELLLTQDSFDDLPSQIKELGMLARQFTFWKTHRLDIFSLADSRMQKHYKMAAKILSLPLEQLFFMTSAEIVQSFKNNEASVTKQTLRERQKTYCLLLYKGRVNFYTPSKPNVQKNLSAKDSIIKGVGASNGNAVGKVKIIKSEANLKQFKQGEVLVTSMTRPEFGTALYRAAAFVTDEGGLMSHAAIISREMGKPCIIGTRIATQILKDGDLVEVDAKKGIVRLLNRGSS